MGGARSGEDPQMALRWQSMTAAEREQAYSPSSCLPDGDYGPYVEDCRRIGRDTWSRLSASAEARTTTVRYGTSPSQTIDVAVPTSSGSDVPIVVFFHGGYWQELSKTDAHFAASDCVRHGWAFGAVDYTLAPDANLSAIVDECRDALRTLQGNAVPLGFRSTEIFVAGSSAGAHLAAMAAIEPADVPVRGAILLSGIFELEPLVGTSINDALGLDPVAARQLSPLSADVDGFPPALLAYGDNETGEFKAQSHAFARHLHAAGTPATVLEIPDRNHFDVILDLADPSTPLGDAVVEFIESRGGTRADD